MMVASLAVPGWQHEQRARGSRCRDRVVGAPGCGRSSGKAVCANTGRGREMGEGLDEGDSVVKAVPVAESTEYYCGWTCGVRRPPRANVCEV